MVTSKLESLHYAVHAFLFNQFSCDICEEILVNGMETICCKKRVCADCYSKGSRDNGSQCPLCHAQGIEYLSALYTSNEEIDEILERFQHVKFKREKTLEVTMNKTLKFAFIQIAS